MKRIKENKGEQKLGREVLRSLLNKLEKDIKIELNNKKLEKKRELS